MINKLSQAGVSPQEIIDILNNLLEINDDSAKCTHIENLRSRVQSPEHSNKLGEILGAIKIPNTLGNGQTVVDPQSGHAYPNTNNLIKDYISELQGHLKVSNNIFNANKYAADKPVQTQDKKKKSTRGNPFRVLMGKVGKLLDHGLEKRDIVRYLLKEKIWNAETIEKAVKIVRDYSRKKHRKPDTNKEKSKKVEAQTLPDTKNVWTRMEKDYSKRSNPELITSICWLSSLDKIDPNKSDFGKEVADRSGVKSIIRKIKTELLARGMSEASINELIK
jgi:hypothetical protein